jgi:hypothetical protein
VSDIKRMPRWPLALIGAPAAVAVWSGWVSLAGLCGFGVVHPLPGIAGGFTINSAITLPVGVEAYAAFALGAWLRPGTPDRARRFAKFSAIGSLTLGTLGQVAYHLLAAAHATRAPWPVVVLVSSLPVVVLGLASGLAHLLREADEDVPAGVTIPAPDATAATVSDVPVDVPADVPEDVPEDVPAHDPSSTVYPRPVTVPRTVPSKRVPRRAPVGKVQTPERVFQAEIERGELPSIRRVKQVMHVGTPRAQEIRNQLAEMLEAQAEAA